jgi:ABC-2 type transport system permease protein
MRNNKNIRNFLLVLIALALINVVSQYLFFRLDLTSEKRYSISPATKQLLKDLKKTIVITIYLEGDLNPGFLRLKKATAELLDEFKVYNKNITYSYINPSASTSPKEREQNYVRMQARGMQGTEVYEKDNEGKSITKIVFPWAEIIYDNKDTIAVNLLKNIPGRSGDENLNISIENLEFEFTDALRVKASKGITKIAFIEGHGELDEDLVYDACSAFSRYFQIDRGKLATDPNILTPYKAIVIAKPVQAFTEQEKFIIDQYIMNGGRVLWLIDGVRIAQDSLSTMGISPAIPHQLNLDDQLFRYGVRIAPVILQDMQSTYVPMNVSGSGQAPNFQLMPFYYSPLLLPSPYHLISKNIVQVKANFTSAIELVGKDQKVKKDILLITSNATNVQSTPSTVDLNRMYEIDKKTFFNVAYVPVAVAMEGVFSSVFTNRMIPKGIESTGIIKHESRKTRMVVVADGDIIRNEVEGLAANRQILPLGYDRYMQKQFGNRSFILNTMLYLADDEGWLALRSREFKLRMLNKRAVSVERKFWQTLNTVLPLVTLLIFMVAYGIIRKRKYSR